MSLFGTYITNNKNSIKESTESSVTSTIQNKKESIKEDNVMDNYGIIVNENGQKELIELSEAEYNAVIEAREALEESGNTMPDLSPEQAAKFAKNSKDLHNKAKIKEFMEKNPSVRMDSAGSKRPSNIDSITYKGKEALKGIGKNIGVAFDALAAKFNMNSTELKKILVVASAATAAGVTITSIVNAIKNTKKKDSTNESVMIFDEDGNAGILEITNEEFEAIVEARLEMDENNVCRLTLTREEAEAIIDARE